MIKLILLRIIEAKYSVSSWLWTGVSTATGLIMASIIQEGVDPGLEKFLDALPFIDPMLWVSLIALSGIALMLGMFIDSDGLVGTSAFVSFACWVFGMITFALLGNVQTIVLLIAPFLIFFAYIFLAAFLRDRNRI